MQLCKKASDAGAFRRLRHTKKAFAVPPAPWRNEQALALPLVLFKISRVPCGVNRKHANSFTNPDKRVTFDTFVENWRSDLPGGAQGAQIRLALVYEGGGVKIVVAQRLLHDHPVGREQDQLRQVIGGNGVGALGDLLGDEPLEGGIALDELGAQRLVAEHGGVDQVQAHPGGGGPRT